MHPNAKTNKKIRSYIQTSEKSISDLASELNVSRVTVRKWKNRDTTEDKSHATNHKTKTIKKQEETILMFLREFINLSIDDMLIISNKLFCLQTSRSSLGRLVNRQIKKHPRMNYKETKNCTKLIIFHANKPHSKLAYILAANTKTKIFHISWIDKTEKNKLFDHLCKILIELNNNHMLLARESDDYLTYHESLQRIHMNEGVDFELYTESGLINVSQEELFRCLNLIISQFNNSQLKNNKRQNLNFVFRAFRFIYNHKTPLSSLRKHTPKQVAQKSGLCSFRP